MAQSGAPRAAVIPAEVLSDMMDETVSHFDVTCPTKCSILLRLTSRRFPSYTFAGKKKNVSVGLFKVQQSDNAARIKSASNEGV